MNIRISLVAARVNAGMHQEDVAKKLHVGKQTVGSWEKGSAEPSISQGLALAHLYRIPVDNIFSPYNLTKSKNQTTSKNR